jgi:hypothetical protein
MAKVTRYVPVNDFRNGGNFLPAVQRAAQGRERLA